MSKHPDYVLKTTLFDGRPVLLQTGTGKRREYHMRYCVVVAHSQTAAKQIQAAWRAGEA